MPRKRPSEKPQTLGFGPLGPRNLKEVYQYIDYGLVDRDMRGRSLGALLMLAGLHKAVAEEPLLQVLARIPANLPLLRSYLARNHAKRQQYTDGAWRNMRANIFAGMRVAGVRVREGRRRIPLSPAWQVLLDKLDEKLCRCIYPFARWCFEQGIEPDGVTPEVLARYEAFLEGFDGRENRRAAFTSMVKAWNRASEDVAGWPAGIKIASRYDRYLLPFSAFDPAYKRDVEQLMHAALNPDPMRSRRRKRINAATAKHQTYQLQRIASALVHATGCDAKTITSVQQLVEPTAARAALRFLTARALARQQARRQQEKRQ